MTREQARSQRLGGRDTDEAFPVVGIGASAGGLEAFRKLFGSLPADSGAGFVLIQHLDPTRESLTTELVGGYTPMPVIQAEDGMRVDASHVYVIPPNTYLSIRERTLRLSVPTAPRSLRMAVDFFLHSLAEDQQDKAIAIVLSGTGSDGTVGLKEVKAAGGMTMVQDPGTAQHDGMLRSAIASGSADFVLAPEQMGDTLLAFVRHLATAPSAPFHPAASQDPLAAALAVLRELTTFDFTGYKKGTLLRRIRRRMSLKQIEDLMQYVEVLRADRDEATALFKDLLINVTSFFREPAAWHVLQEQVVRRLVAEKSDASPIRVWVPACATGEEAYSVAMLLLEELRSASKIPRLQVFASDVDGEALGAGRAGVYPEGIERHVAPGRLSRFFTRNDHSYRVNKELRDAVVFAQQSLISDPPFSKLDLICCRNLFIYLEPRMQDDLIPLMHFALLEGGYLFLGAAESIGRHEDLFEVVSKKHRIYRRIGPTRHDRVRFPIVTTRSAAPIAAQAGEPRPGRLSNLIQYRLLQRYAPACAIVDRGGEIVYFHGAIDEYLTQPSGPPTQDLLARARDGLRSKLRSAFHESLRTNQRVQVRCADGRERPASDGMTITVEPLGPTRESEGLWVVSFERATAHAATTPAKAPDASDAQDPAPAIADQLESELRTMREDLNRTIEDVRASNEELMSVNEEFQSTNEELETSKEELQSLNEELTTSNAQLEGKIGELEATNNDLDNLLTSTNIATLFLDTELRIRRFTPAATVLFRLIPSDMGRPIGDIVQKFADPDLLSDARAVLQQPASPRKEVQAEDGRWYVRQVLPYRTRDDRTEGVVITLSDVAAEALAEARLYAESIVDTVREPLLVLDEGLRIQSANRSFYETFLVAPEATVGRLLHELGDHQWDIPELRARLLQLVAQGNVLNDFEVMHDFHSVGPRTMLLNARTLRRAGGRPTLILLAIEDVTDRKRAEEALQESRSQKRLEEQVRQRQAELVHAQRVSMMGELASGLAHELNQPLSAIANGVEACAHYVRSGKAKSTKLLELLNDTSTEALRAAEIVEHLRGFIQKGTPQLVRADLCQIIRNVMRFLGHELEREGIALRIDLGARPLPVLADRIQIEQVIVNLLQNAIDALRDGARGHKQIDVRARLVEGMAEVEVHDSGAGMSIATAERMFDPFFTTKPEGLGMGLAISRSIIEAHRGRTWVAPFDGDRGTTVCFSLPLERARRGRKGAAR